MPNGTISLQLPTSRGWKKKEEYRKIADANAQARCVPRPSARARR